MVAGQAAEGIDEAGQVLARLQGADGKKIGIGQAESPPHAFAVIGRGIVPKKGGVHAGRRHADTFRLETEHAHRFPRRVLGMHEDETRFLSQTIDHPDQRLDGSRLVPGRIDQEAHVVQGEHVRSGAKRQEGEVGEMEQVHPPEMRFGPVPDPAQPVDKAGGHGTPAKANSRAGNCRIHPEPPDVKGIEFVANRFARGGIEAKEARNQAARIPSDSRARGQSSAKINAYFHEQDAFFS